uniref:hypothetical protein n=1 Tax=Streptomyces corallincola TaxID=2851888 RepID=UPI0027E2A000|nr:hypothetical protein [Streptomyces corallincola]
MNSASLQGSWLRTGHGVIVALVVTGERAGLFTSDGTVCGGTAPGGAGPIRLTCAHGSDERGTGTIGEVNSRTLKVRWSGTAGEETYGRAAGGTLPPGLPTAAGPGRHP